MHDNNRILYKGTVEYLRVELNASVSLTGTVEFSFDRRNWLTAEWEGGAATRRVARYLVDLSTTNSEVVPGTIYVRLSDVPEIPVFPVGTLTIR